MSANVIINNNGTIETWADIEKIKTKQLPTTSAEWSIEPANKGLIALTVGKDGAYVASDFGAFAITEINVKNDGSAPVVTPVEEIDDGKIISILVGGTKRVMSGVKKLNMATDGDDAIFGTNNTKTKYVSEKGTYRAKDENCIGYTRVDVAITSMYPKNYNGVPYGEYDETQRLAGKFIKAKGKLTAMFQTRYPQMAYTYIVDSDKEEEFYSAFTVEASFALTMKHSKDYEIIRNTETYLAKKYWAKGERKGQSYDDGPEFQTYIDNKSEGTWRGVFRISPLSAPAGQFQSQIKRKTIVIKPYNIYQSENITEIIVKAHISPVFVRQNTKRTVMSYGLDECGLTWESTADDPMINIGEPFNDNVYTFRYYHSVIQSGNNKLVCTLAAPNNSSGNAIYGSDDTSKFESNGVFGLAMDYTASKGFGFTVDVIRDLYNTGVKGGRGDADVYMADILIPITEIEYLGDYENAPESAKTVREDDLLDTGDQGGD